MKLNQLHDAKRHLKRSIELTKNELPYIALAKACLLEDHVTEARDAYTAALRYKEASPLSARLHRLNVLRRLNGRLTSRASRCARGFNSAEMVSSNAPFLQHRVLCSTFRCKPAIDLAFNRL